MTPNTPFPKQVCPKCGGDMERGYLMAHMNISFAPETEFNKLIGKGTATFANRCKNCGYCEIYAPVTRQVGKDKSK